MNAIKYSCTGLILLSLILVTITLTGCPATTMSTADFRQIEDLQSQAPGGADDFIIVDCVLPGQIRQLGTGMMFISRGPSKKLTAEECATMGGKFAIPGQSDYTRALMVWQPDAQAGDKEAQYYVGQIYQRGLGAAPNYSRAAEWYRKAADQGYAKAQMNLAYLYENGLGVEKDLQQAQRWYRRATGLGESISLDENVLSIEERQELQELREENKRRNEETRMLQQKLDRIQKDLEDSRQELKQRSNDIENETQRQEVAGLEKKIADDEKIINELSEKLAQNETKLNKLPAPLIEIYDPIAQTTRGGRD